MNKLKGGERPFLIKFIRVVLYILMTLFIVLGRSAQWAMEEWGDLDMGQITFTLTQPLNGTNPGIIRDYLFYAVFPAFAVLFAVMSLTFFLKGKKRCILLDMPDGYTPEASDGSELSPGVPSSGDEAISSGENEVSALPSGRKMNGSGFSYAQKQMPRPESCRKEEKGQLRRELISRFILPITCVVSIIFGSFQIAGFWNSLEVGSYIHSLGEQSTYIVDNYVDPGEVQLIFPQKKRNLLYIYLESMEVSYSDEANGGIFTDNYIPELTQIAKEAEDFSGSSSLTLNGAVSWDYTTWTMGGMFAATTGLPLKIPLEVDGVDTNFMSTQDSFFPNITSLGNILQEEGYNNNLLIGSDATFGGRRLYFSEHGDYEFYDYNYYSESGELPNGYKVFWGFEDEKLFEFAKERLEQLSSSDQPFNLTMLTVDTHYPNGYVCELCGDQYDTQYANVIACSDAQVSKFLRWCETQDWYGDTAIVVSGDHPTMAKDFCSGADADYVRKVYTAYLNSSVSPVMDEYREFSTADLFPTTLAAMGVQIEGDRLGMGVNLFSDEDTLTERDGADLINAELDKASSWMDSQAKVEAVTADITYDPYDEVDHKLTFTIRNVSSDKIDSFRVCMRMYGYIVDGSDYIKWISADEVSDGEWYVEFDVPVEQAFDGIVKLQPTCIVNGARSNVLDLHYYHLKYDEGGGNCEWYECDYTGQRLED